MPTKRVRIKLNSTVISGRGPLDYSNYIFSVRGEDKDEIPDELLTESRWFHYEFRREEEGVEKYTRRALFGKFALDPDTKEKRFLIQRLTGDNRRPDSSAQSHDKEEAISLKSLEDQLGENVKDLHAAHGEEVETDISWHELEQSKLCHCFRVNEDEDSKEKDNRLHSFSQAVPIGRVYFMYCFSLSDFFYVGPDSKSGKEKSGPAEVRQAGAERRIVEFYRGKDCRLEKTVFKVERSTEVAGEESESDEREPVLINAEMREAQLNSDGQEFSIFRTKLKNSNWLTNKTYRLRINKRTEYFLRLSKTGLIEVRKERRLTGDDNQTLAKILEGLLRFRRVDTGDERNYVDMSGELNDIVKTFARHIIESYQTQPNSTDVHFMEKAEPGKRDRRYVAIVLRDLKCGKKLPLTYPSSAPQSCGLSIKPSDVHRNIEVVSSFLEGTMIYDENSGELLIPRRPSRTPKELPDLSSWSEEICFFESDRALIYFEPKTILESYNHVANYEAYWRAIVRGIEHQLSIRTSLQKMETTTTKLTAEIPELLVGLDASRGAANSDKPEIQMAQRSKLDELASGVSQVVSLLPKLRQISITATAFRSSKAINKFDRLGKKCFRFPEMLRNIQQNVDELGDFLQYAKAQELRKALIDLEEEIEQGAKKEKKRDKKLVRIGLLIAVGSVIFASFSFLSDAAGFFRDFPVAGVQRGFFSSPGAKSVAVYVILCLMLGLIIWQMPTYLEWLSKSDEEREKGSADSKRRLRGWLLEKKYRAGRIGAMILILVLLILLIVTIVRG